MFKSIKYKTFNSDISKYTYDLEDSDFGIVEVVIGIPIDDIKGSGVIIAREYSKRNLDVGKNLAILIINLSNDRPYFTTNRLCKWQDEYCPDYIESWKDYISDRNEWLKRLLLLT